MNLQLTCDTVMALPLRLLWGLKVNLQQKIALAAIFSLGFIIIAFAVVRVVETGATFKHVNPMWLALWSMIEASVGKHFSFVLRYAQKRDSTTGEISES